MRALDEPSPFVKSKYTEYMNSWSEAAGVDGDLLRLKKLTDLLVALCCATRAQARVSCKPLYAGCPEPRDCREAGGKRYSTRIIAVFFSLLYFFSYDYSSIVS